MSESENGNVSWNALNAVECSENSRFNFMVA